MAQFYLKDGGDKWWKYYPAIFQIKLRHLFLDQFARRRNHKVAIGRSC
jgi:hypothetical protein